MNISKHVSEYHDRKMTAVLEVIEMAADFFQSRARRLKESGCGESEEWRSLTAYKEAMDAARSVIFAACGEGQQDDDREAELKMAVAAVKTAWRALDQRV